jgi:hypothetical protein
LTHPRDLRAGLARDHLRRPSWPRRPGRPPAGRGTHRRSAVGP